MAEFANNKNRTPVEEIGLHTVLFLAALGVTVVALVIIWALFTYSLLPTIWHRLGATLILILAVLQCYKLVKATYYEFFVTRRSR